MTGPTVRIPGLVLTDRRFEVPLNHGESGGEKITVFAREAVAPGNEDRDLPWLVFLQGGPGFGSPRPEDRSGWLKVALARYRVLLLDQRGTGRSSPIDHRTLATRGTPREQADYLKHFRADSIVQDVEHIRRSLTGESGLVSLLGQSYGGFCAVHYLSAAPDGLRDVFITGGLPPLRRSAEDVYRATYRTVELKNRRYYERYPDDVDRVREVVAFLDANDVRLPSGKRLTTRQFQQLGLHFGMSNGFEQVHYLIEDAFVAGPGGPEPGYAFVHGVEISLPYNTNPIFSVLHEPCYAQGEATSWAAERVRPEYPSFQPDSNRPVYFTGEMIYPWMFDEYPRLQPLKEVAEILAAEDDWPVLYDPEALGQNRVPVVAAVYHNDMYVGRDFSLETADAIRGIRVWTTDEYEHNGLRSQGEKVLAHLFELRDGER